MPHTLLFILLGYLSGSVLFARICAKVGDKPGILTESKDGNPGATNAFLYGGPLCGLVTLVGDMTKGFLPVFAYRHLAVPAPGTPLLAALVLAAPVFGHTCPLFYRFRGGKGIAVTFGCLLGLFPDVKPVAALALCFIFFSLVLQITPHLARTAATYLTTLLVLLWLRCPAEVALGFVLIAAAVLLRLYFSREQREKIEVRLPWKR